MNRVHSFLLKPIVRFCVIAAALVTFAYFFPIKFSQKTKEPTESIQDAESLMTLRGKLRLTRWKNAPDGKVLK